MRNDSNTPRPLIAEPALWLGALAVVLTWLGLMLTLRFDPLGHAVHDSFTLQALAWRKGMLSLGQDYPWLELAIYNNDWYVSFPSVPALVMLPLTLLFGEATPNTLMTGLYFLGAYFAAYALARRWRKPNEACFMALFMTLGCNLLDLSLTGDVWNQAQLLCFFLTAVFAAGITGKSRAGWAIGLGCLALSVGCRPFQAVFVPFALYRLYQNVRGDRDLPRALMRMIPYVIFPAMVALALGAYNYARFGNPLEFGHNYLPEFTRDPNQPQLGLKYIAHNVQNLLRMPWMNEGRLEFVRFDGFAFWMCNPIYVSLPVALLLRGAHRRLDATDAILCVSFAAEIFLLLMHKTFGGWQFGARYLCDLIPMMLLVELRGRRRTAPWEAAIGLFAIAFNLYGTVVFHMMDMGL